MKYIIDLFLSFVKIGFLAFGGGYGALSIIQDEIVRVHKWMGNLEFLDLLSIAQITPGPIAINSATYIGYKIGGFPGSVAATVGVILPSFVWMYVIVGIMDRIFKKSKKLLEALQIGIISPILAAGISLSMSSIIDYKALALAVFLFIFIRLKRIPLFHFVLISGVLGMIVGMFS